MHASILFKIVAYRCTIFTVDLIAAFLRLHRNARPISDYTVALEPISWISMGRGGKTAINPPGHDIDVIFAK